MAAGRQRLQPTWEVHSSATIVPLLCTGVLPSSSAADALASTGPPLPQVHNNFGGGFVSDEDRVALSAIKFASAESAGAKCISGGDGHNSWLEASMEQLCVPLPPWSLRAGARETIWFNPLEVNAASERRGGSCAGLLSLLKVADAGWHGVCCCLMQLACWTADCMTS